MSDTSDDLQAHLSAAACANLLRDVLARLQAAPQAEGRATAERDSLADFVVRFKALPDDRPPAVRVRLLLKYALRAQALQNVGLSDAPGASQARGPPLPRP